MRSYIHIIIFSLITWLSHTSLWAQAIPKNDSLLTALRDARGEQRFAVLNELFKFYNSTDYDQALKFAELYSKYAYDTGDSVKIVLGGRMMAYTLMDKGQNDLALTILKDRLKVAERNLAKYPELRQQMKFLLNNAGIASMYLGEYSQSLGFHFKSLILREEDGDKKGIKNTLNNIGLVYFNLKDYQKAQRNFLKAIEISESIEQVTDLDRIYVNLGLCYNELNEYSEAIKSFEKVFSICGDGCSDNIMKEGLEGLAQAYYYKGEIQKAKDGFTKSLAIAKKQNDSRYICENQYLLSLIEFDSQNYEKSFEYLEQAKGLAEQFNFAEARLDIYKEFSKIYGHKNDLRNSVFFLEKYISLRDSVYSDQLIRDLANIQTDFAERENLKTIAEKDQVLVLKEEVIARQRRQFVFIVVITCLVVALAWILFYFSKRQQKVNQELSEAKNKIQEQNLQLSGYNRELEIKANERTKDLNMSNETLRRLNNDLDNFIYKTSHDIRGPLATLKGMVNLALVDVKDDVALTYLSRMDYTAERLNTIITRLTIVNHINNSQLAPSIIVFRDIIENILLIEKKKGIPENFKISYHIEPGTILISDEEIVRIILENLIDNAFKFYNNSERVEPFVNINVSREDQFVKITVEDNGIGIFNKPDEELFQLFVRASERSDIGGVGLYLVKIATEKLGGLITLEKSSEKGSLFKVLLPEDMNLLKDQKSPKAIQIRQKVEEMRMKKKIVPAVSNS